MKNSKISFKVILSFLFLLGVLFSSNFASVSFAENLSDLKVDKYVNDYANIIDDNAERELESTLYNYFASSTNQIVIVTVNNLDQDYIEHYSIKLADKIKAGSEKNDNGVILLVAKDDKQMRIEVGYGLEPTLTDGKSSYIINNILKPNFKNNNYTAGIQQATQEIINITSDANYKSAGDTKSKSLILRNKLLNYFFIFLWIIIFIFGWLISIAARSKSWWAGGVFGGAAGLFLAYIVQDLFASIFSIVFFAAMGLLVDYKVSKNYLEHKSGNKKGPPSWWAGGATLGGGGGWSSSSSGGFSGSGGSFGGGGSSGSW